MAKIKINDLEQWFFKLVQPACVYEPKIWPSISSFYYSFGVLLEAGIGPSSSSASAASLSELISCRLDAHGFFPPNKFCYLLPSMPGLQEENPLLC